MTPILSNYNDFSGSNVTADVASWAAGATNNGWVVINDTGTAGQYVVFVASEDGGNQSPKLIVDYTAGGAAITGTLSTTNANDTLSASGSLGSFGILGTTNANDTLSGTGAQRIGGTVSVTNANDTLSSGAGGTLTLPALKNNTATLQTGLTGLTTHVLSSSGVLVVTKTGQTSDGTTGVVVITDASIVASTVYRVALIDPATGAVGITDAVTAT